MTHERQRPSAPLRELQELVDGMPREGNRPFTNFLFDASAEDLIRHYVAVAQHILRELGYPVVVCWSPPVTELAPLHPALRQRNAPAAAVSAAWALVEATHLGNPKLAGDDRRALGPVASAMRLVQVVDIAIAAYVNEPVLQDALRIRARQSDGGRLKVSNVEAAERECRREAAYRDLRARYPRASQRDLAARMAKALGEKPETIRRWIGNHRKRSAHRFSG